MQLIDICTNAIALLGAVYFIAAWAAHLVHCWGHPPVKAITVKPIVALEFNPLEMIDLCKLLLLLPQENKMNTVQLNSVIDTCNLLLPATELHPWELAVEKMVDIESITALHQPATLEPSIELPPVEVAPHVEPDAPIDYQAMSSQQLRAICTQHGTKWRSVKAGKHLNKPEMISALSAV